MNLKVATVVYIKCASQVCVSSMAFRGAGGVEGNEVIEGKYILRQD